jgi:hypothetical protein
MSIDNYLIAFKAISNFTACLNEVFGATNRSLKLYAHLISKTTFSHEIPIKKHIKAFKEFCVINKKAIFSKDASQLDPKVIIYSQRVYIDLGSILEEISDDKTTINVIWTHLLTILALLDPTSRAKEILQENICKDTDDNQESDFLSNIINKVEKHVDPSSNPMEAVSSILKSGIFTELVGGMGNGLQDGSLDIGKLMGTVNKMVSKMNNDVSDNCGDEDPMGLINTMMSSLSAGSKTSSSDEGSKEVELPIGSMMNMLGPLMNGLSNGGLGNSIEGNPMESNSIENSINAQFQKARDKGVFSGQSFIHDND